MLEKLRIIIERNEEVREKFFNEIIDLYCPEIIGIPTTQCPKDVSCEQCWGKIPYYEEDLLSLDDTQLLDYIDNHCVENIMDIPYEEKDCSMSCEECWIKMISLKWETEKGE